MGITYASIINDIWGKINGREDLFYLQTLQSLEDPKETRFCFQLRFQKSNRDLGELAAIWVVAVLLDENIHITRFEAKIIDERGTTASAECPDVPFVTKESRHNDLRRETVGRDVSKA